MRRTSQRKPTQAWVVVRVFIFSAWLGIGVPYDLNMKFDGFSSLEDSLRLDWMLLL